MAAVSFVIIIGLVALVMFALPYITKRRFGMAGLALAAGSMLAALWVGDVTPLISSAGVVMVQPPLESVVTVGLTILPAIVVLSASPKTSLPFQRIGGSVLFAALAIALLLPALQSALMVDESGRAFHDMLVDNRAIIVTVGLVAAVLDVAVKVKPPKSSKH